MLVTARSGLAMVGLSAVVSELGSRLDAVPTSRVWPPSWFGIAEGSADDVSERVEEILAEGFGQPRS